MKKIYTIFGFLGPIIYILAVFIGGAIRNDYSQIYNTISELSMATAPNLVLMDIMFGIYNIALLLFAVGAFQDSEVDTSKKYKAAMLMLAITGVLGLVLIFFPQDPRGIFTPTGTTHIAVAGISSLLTILTLFITGFNFRKKDRMNDFANYSFISGIIVVISGGISAYSVGNNLFFGGLLEKITILTFIVWVMVFSYVILKKK
ncbi:DUF998 domain-containing protein [Methanobacterium sp. MBAC-LM]|jgi:hypothetical membrane protein|uniref:DUF998 domain-containing protein n=1 Tax=Methanobacterium sp. MBAC-LM TaxID=3412034 RepID=UPI003C76D542